jgi:hypothetical protein
MESFMEVGQGQNWGCSAKEKRVEVMKLPSMQFSPFSYYFFPLRPKYSPEHKQKKNSVALVRKRTIPTERPPLVGEVSANFS